MLLALQKANSIGVIALKAQELAHYTITLLIYYKKFFFFLILIIFSLLFLGF